MHTTVISAFTPNGDLGDMRLVARWIDRADRENRPAHLRGALWHAADIACNRAESDLACRAADSIASAIHGGDIERARQITAETIHALEVAAR